mgnify:CR=1 FL=1
MRKSITLLLCLTMGCALSLTLLVGCNENLGTATKIEIVNPVTEYVVGSEINYDELSAKITYDSGKTKEGTVKKLSLTVKEKADLSKVGKTSYTVTYGALSQKVEISVIEANITAFAMPKFYSNYLLASKDRTATQPETRADFRQTGEIYEVGNVNKFIFRPVATAIGEEGVADITDVKTTAKVYEKTSKDGEYRLIPETDLEGIVKIENNTYKFAEETAGKYYKVEVSIDENEYGVSSLRDSDKTITFECVIIGGGYNVYDQTGLSVMNDLTSTRWQDIWKCTVDNNTFEITSNENSLKLEADDKPLCDYVGKIDWVVLHASFELNADLLPDYFFWTEQTEGYATAKDRLTANQEAQKLLVGSLRDGVGNKQWWQIINTGESGNRPVNYGINMQKGFFSTSKVSVSGNYNGITTPVTASEGGRNLFIVGDQDGSVNNPTPHWQIFQMLQPTDQPTELQFNIKNLAVTGNMKQLDTSDYVPAGLNMFNGFGNVNFFNIVGNGFYVNVTCDSYGATSFKADSAKIYDAYSNMIYMWRAKADVTNCEFIGAGGPLFILSDGNHTSTEGGRYSDLTVDEKTVLQAYATGNESWYQLYGAQALVNYVKGTFETGVFNNVKKTVRFTKDANGNMVPYKDGASGDQYINFIAAMICEPGDLFTGLNEGMMLLRGTYTTVKENGDVIEKFDLMNPYVQALRAQAQNDGTRFAPIFQTGENMMFTDGQGLYTLGATGAQPFNPATDGVKWATDTHSKLAVYMSAGALSHSKNAPYFGVILDCASYGM